MSANQGLVCPKIKSEFDHPLTKLNRLKFRKKWDNFKKTPYNIKV